MKVSYPAYYKKFRCLASACPDTCCKDWDIEIDEKTEAFYRSIPGETGERLRQFMAEEDGVTVVRQSEGHCPMLTEDGLCGIQLRYGEQALCEVCRTFPRLHHDYGTFLERDLEMSCPEAARLLLTEGDAPVCTEEVPGGEEPGYDPEEMKILLKSRKKALELLADPRFTVPEAMALLLFYGCSVQEELYGMEEEEFLPEQALKTGRELAKKENAESLLTFYKKLEILTEEWKNRLECPDRTGDWTEMHRNFLRYGIRRYWLQAVSDGDLTARIKMILSGCLLIHSLGGDVFRTSQLYSKEIENDPENVDAILSAAYSEPAFTDLYLLGLLLKEK